MNTIIWKGVPSTTIDGLLICELPTITKPPMRVSETTIDGRDGSVIEELGYSSYDKTITIGLHGNFDINKIIKYFTGEGEIVFSNEPDKVYIAKIIGQIDYNRLLRFRQAVVPFRVQPFKHKYLEVYKEPQTITAEGTSIVVPDIAEAKQRYFSIYGKTTQDGTPTPDSPVELVSVGDSGSITVNATREGESQSMTIATPNGLRGIPVTSGGNYTDANGQQWVCDEIDLARGVYTKRVHQEVITADKIESVDNQYFATGGTTSSVKLSRVNLVKNDLETIVSNYAVGVSLDDRATGENKETYRCYTVQPNYFVFRYPVSVGKKTVEDARMDFAGAMVKYILATPIETPLSAEELATYAELPINEPNATVLNDANAYMKLEYFKPFEVFNEGLENSKPIMVLRGSGTVGIFVNGIHIFDYTFPEGEKEVVIDSEKQDAYLGEVLKNRNMNGEFPILLAGTNKIEWSGYVESIEILPRSRWL
jgi:predicted phage tail component-like protein